MALIKVNGINLNVEAFGKGRPVIIAHGLSGNLKVMYPIKKMLAGGYQVIMYDSRGHGKSDKPASYTLEDHANDLIGLMDVLGLEKASIIGFSMGSYIAAAAAAKAPKRIEKLILMGTKGEGTTSSVERILREKGLDPATVQGMKMNLALSSSTFSPKTGLIKKALTMLPQWMQPLTPEQKAAENKALENFNLFTEYPKITAPTLVIAGQLDGINPPHLGKAVSEAIPGAQYKVIEKASHMMFVEKKKAVRNAILDFLGSEKEIKAAGTRRKTFKVLKTVVALVVAVALIGAMGGTAFSWLYSGRINEWGWGVFINSPYLGEQYKTVPQDKVIMVGSSSLDFWDDDMLATDFPGYEVYSNAVMGTGTLSQIYHLEKFATQFNPEALIYYCGWNDLNNGRPAEIVTSGTQYYLQLAHSKMPNTKIIYLSLTPNPVGERFVDETNKAMAEMKEYCDQFDWLTYVDSEQAFRDENGQVIGEYFKSDGIHPSEPGYRAWAHYILEGLDTALGK